MNRAYAVLTVKSVDSEQRVFSGMATTPTTDRVGDIVEPLGIKYAASMPLLLFHDHENPVGTVKFGRPTKDGVAFHAHLPEITEPGLLKDQVDRAWHLVKYQLIRAVSIGFRPINEAVERLKSGGLRFLETEVLELSMVAVPANAEALISTIKSIDASHLAALGTGDKAVAATSSGVTDSVQKTARKDARRTMTTYQERIKDVENQIGAKQAELNSLQDKVSGEGRSKDESERESFDTTKSEIKSLLDELTDLRDLEEMATKSVPVVGTKPTPVTKSRDTHTVVVSEPKLDPGIGLARFAMASIAARKNNHPILEVAKGRWPNDTRLQAYIQKANVPAGTTTDATWASPLVDQTNLANEFIEYLRPRTIVGRIPGLKRVPFNIRVTGQSSGAVANWVGQGKGKPVTSFSTFATTLLRTKIAAIAVITEELALDSSPSAEQLVRDELARAVIERMDVDFIDPAQAAVAGVNPASITYGVTPLSPSGTSEAQARADMVTLLSQFVENNVDPTGLVLIMPNSLALGLSLMVNSLGQPSFPGINPTGGTLLGIPVVASQYAGNQSGAGNLVIALNAGDIFLADDGQVRLDASREATIEMSDAPLQNATVPTGAATTNNVNMFQANAIAIRAERYINWAKVRSTAVVFMDDVNWGSVGSPG